MTREIRENKTLAKISAPTVGNVDCTSQVLSNFQQRTGFYTYGMSCVKGDTHCFQKACQRYKMISV